MWNCNSSPPAMESSHSQNVQFLTERGFNYWGKRSNPKDATLAAFFLEKAFSMDSTNFDLGFLASRAYYYTGYYIEADLEKKDSLFLRGAEMAFDIFKTSPAYQSAFASATGDSMRKMIQAVSSVGKKYISALYWWAANMGSYLSTKSVRERLDYREAVEAVMHRVSSLNPDYFYGGPNRFFGAFYARLPGVELNRSGDFFQKAVTTYPDYLGTYVLRAKFLHTKAEDRDLFHKDLQYVIQADPSIIPDVMPENLFEQEIARSLLADEEMLFK